MRQCFVVFKIFGFWHKFGRITHRHPDCLRQKQNNQKELGRAQNKKGKENRVGEKRGRSGKKQRKEKEKDK